MVGLVIATHGRLAEELVHTAEGIVGAIPDVKACGIEPGSSPESICDAMRKAIAQVDSGDGVIVLADLFGGTPCNQSLTLCSNARVEVVTGVNLPMLIKAAALRTQAKDVSEFALTLAQYGQKNITCASALLRAAEARQN